MNGKRFTAVIAALALVLSAFAAPGVFAGFANASDHTGISASPDNAGETSTVSLTEDVPSNADSETFASFKINADSTDFSNVAASDVTVGIDTNGDGAVDTTQSSDVSSVSTSDSGTTLTVSMNTGSTSIATLADSDDLIIDVANASNPADEGDYSVSTQVNGYEAGSHTLDITPPLSSTTFTVVDRDGNAVESATIAVEGSTYTTDANGTVSADLTAWEHTVVVSADGYDDDSREITVAEGGDSAEITIDERGAEVASPQVEGVQLAAEQPRFGFAPTNIGSFDLGFLTEEVTSLEVSEQATDGTLVVDMQGSDLTDDFSTEASDGEPVDEFTVEVDGEKVPVYSANGDNAEDGATYGVYDSDAQSVTVHLGDDYNGSEEVDVGVSSNELGFDEQFDVFGLDDFVPGGVPGL
ncbi:carboxypeptidase regulatory-like domain-containing protein [Halopenitus persicus]|uniref:carboxypeptidase regulatory-like domain-containing protein n=1 Tax=Halopenitus persicus TaxID=1048396 RepID=UPI0012FD1909|nr:carboxypeptidase regulatory-like domain-containing protein [Halopenitus persicus]